MAVMLAAGGFVVPGLVLDAPPAAVGGVSGPEVSLPTLILDDEEAPLPSRTLTSLLDDLRSMSSAGAPRPLPRAPSNPCAMDLHAHGCSDTACLKAHAEQLSPPCERFLMGGLNSVLDRMPMASPAPMAPLLRPSRLSRLSRPDFGGALLSPTAGVPPEMAQILSLFSTFATPLMGSMMRSMPASIVIEVSEVDPEEEEQEAERPSDGHPCANEISRCVALVRTRDRAPIESCLLRNFPQLGDKCKCFLHHVAPDKVDAIRAKLGSPPPKPMPQPRYAPARLYAKDPDAVVVPEPAPRREPRLPHILLALANLVLIALIVRLACRLCCGARRPPARLVVIDPPAHGVDSKAMQALATPLSSAEIREVKAVDAEGRYVRI